MTALTLTLDGYRDKVLGGWTGKSIGITLGAPQRGQMIPGHARFYQPVPGQPTASIAMDFPLVWLAAVEEAGPDVTPEDLAVAWLEHLDYPEDEFGYAALNLRRGLSPPASGAYSNWFQHADGGLFRADLWAMLAPGAPQVAAAYAYHDTKLDHAEDGIWAPMFLAALGSAAFFLSDPLLLLTIGLAMIPRTCRTARAVKAALAAGQRGAGWLEARESILKEVGHSNYTDGPQNMGFFTLGLLYGGNDWGEALCAAVNCGYDAEIVGGALGAIRGILIGHDRLPENWTQPLGDVVIAGTRVRDFDVPRTLTELADRTVVVGRRFVVERCPNVEIVDTPEEEINHEGHGEEIQGAKTPLFGGAEFNADSIADIIVPEQTVEKGGGEGADPTPLGMPGRPDWEAPAGEAMEPAHQEDWETGLETEGRKTEEAPVPTDATPEAAPAAPQDVSDAIAWADSTLVKPLLVTPTNAQVAHVGAFEIVVDTGETPTITFNQPKTLSVHVRNRGTAFSGRITLEAPQGWQVNTPPNMGQRQILAAHQGAWHGEFTVRVNEGQSLVEITNKLILRLAPEDGSVPLEAAILLLGASCWWIVGTFANFDGEGFDRAYTPEDRPGLREGYLSRNLQTVHWEKHSFPEATLDIEPFFRGSSGVCYGQTIFRSPAGIDARLVANTNSGVKVWLNGPQVLRRFHRETYRPQLGSGPWAINVNLHAGDNLVLVKWVRGAEPCQFSLTLSDREGRGLPEIGNTNW